MIDRRTTRPHVSGVGVESASELLLLRPHTASVEEKLGKAAAAITQAPNGL